MYSAKNGHKIHIEMQKKKLHINDVRVSTQISNFAYFFVQIQMGCQESGHNYPDFLDAAFCVSSGIRRHTNIARKLWWLRLPKENKTQY